MVLAAAVLIALGGTFGIARASVTIPYGYSASPNITFTTLTLLNGWTGGPFGTSVPAVAKSKGLVYFRGAMSTTGSNAVAFVLPSGFRPSAAVYLSVDMCDASYGRLFIDTTGTATVQTATFSNAQCFTSLDGVFFAQ
ncbi:MAG: hypothetical protein JO043_13480 [Candidatus Eremiobacteraeota bacterium]|nr:hypothetical protein [Candidatus Eremiobacteraeota bacterium]